MKAKKKKEGRKESRKREEEEGSFLLVGKWVPSICSMHSRHSVKFKETSLSKKLI